MVLLPINDERLRSTLKKARDTLPTPPPLVQRLSSSSRACHILCFSLLALSSAFLTVYDAALRSSTTRIWYEGFTTQASELAYEDLEPRMQAGVVEQLEEQRKYLRLVLPLNIFVPAWIYFNYTLFSFAGLGCLYVYQRCLSWLNRRHKGNRHGGKFVIGSTLITNVLMSHVWPWSYDIRMFLFVGFPWGYLIGLVLSELAHWLVGETWQLTWEERQQRASKAYATLLGSVQDAHQELDVEAALEKSRREY